jgi:hypothetical protein
MMIRDLAQRRSTPRAAIRGALTESCLRISPASFQAGVRRRGHCAQSLIVMPSPCRATNSAGIGARLDAPNSRMPVVTLGTSLLTGIPPDSCGSERRRLIRPVLFISLAGKIGTRYRRRDRSFPPPEGPAREPLERVEQHRVHHSDSDSNPFFPARFLHMITSSDIGIAAVLLYALNEKSSRGVFIHREYKDNETNEMIFHPV